MRFKQTEFHLRWIVVVWLIASTFSFAAPVDLVTIGSTFRLSFGQPPSEPADAWTQIEFDDSQWANHPGGFGTSSYNEDTVTLLPGLTETTATYFFRKSFSLGSLDDIQALILRLKYFGGVAVHLNGIELYRRNLPGESTTPIPWDAPATNPTLVNEILEVPAPKARLRPGKNVLAVELHGIGSSTYFGQRIAGLLVELLGNFSRGPWIQNTSSNSTDILWHTPLSQKGRVEYGLTPALGLVAPEFLWRSNHVAQLTHLTPNSTYHYRIVVPTPQGNAISPTLTFRTFSTSGNVRFQILGDSGSGSTAQLDIANAMDREPADLVLHVGDIVYPGMRFEYIDTRVTGIYRSQMLSTPFYFAIGNHDITYSRQPFLYTFRQPTNSVSAEDHLLDQTAPEFYYSFDHGDVHFVALYQPFGNQYLFKPDSPQARWLESDLAGTKKPWKVLYFHVSPNTSSLHRHDDYNSILGPDRLEIQQVVVPIAKKYGVQLIAAGHDHNWEKFVPENGIHTIVTGGGGATPYYIIELDAQSRQFISKYQFTAVEVDGDLMTIRCLGKSGVELDRLYIRRSKPVSRIYDIAWHSPTVEEPRPLRDASNIPGQSYELIGDSATAISGQWSNLGQLQVNADAQNIYVGLHHLLLPNDADALLFIESPRTQGVTDLERLRDDLRPPPIRVSGLLNAQNLAFTNFAPSIACVLGDEAADNTLPQFNGLHGKSGQGVFALTPQLSPVRGSRLQQFNRSPERPIPPDNFYPYSASFSDGRESSADFIEMAIPRSALGNPQPGDLLQIGVVAARNSSIHPLTPTREVDTGFIGRDLIRTNQRHWLTGLTFALPGGVDSDGDGLSDARELELALSPANSDTDSDGLPDGWEVANDLDPKSAVHPFQGSSDLDRDGLTNLQEYRLGTDPKDPQSRLSLLWDPAQPHMLRWRSPLVGRIRLLHSANVEGPYIGIDDAQLNLAPPGELSEYRAAATAMFFRLAWSL